MKNTGRLALTAIALLLAAQAGAQSVRAGIEAWQKGDYGAAITAWRPLAAKGDADAAFNLGQAYRLGKGVPLSLASAQGWYEKAARAGHVDAATSLGILLFQNGNRTAAMRWLKQAAEAGEPRALLLYGTALYNGDGVPRDPVTAYAYVSRAAAQGLAPARATLADMDEMMPIEQRQQGVALAKAAAGAKTSAKPGAKPVKAPVVKPVPAPPAAKPIEIVAGGAWRVQLGAFSKRGSAEALFKALAAGPLAGRQPYYVAAGAVTRLQAGPFGSKTDAAAACTRLSARGQPCFPVAAR